MRGEAVESLTLTNKYKWKHHTFHTKHCEEGPLMPLFIQATKGSLHVKQGPEEFISQGEYHPGTATAQHRTVSIAVVKITEQIIGTQLLAIQRIDTTCCLT